MEFEVGDRIRSGITLWPVNEGDLGTVEEVLPGFGYYVKMDDHVFPLREHGLFPFPAEYVEAL